MATQPQPPAKPQSPPAHAPQASGKPTSAHEALPIGAKPTDPKDPQAVKFNPPTSSPPRWDDKPVEAKPAPEWEPKAAIDPREEKPPPGVYADGMDIATEQRLRSAKVEQLGTGNYPPDENAGAEPKQLDKHALSGGGAFVSAGAQHQVAGVAPPTKRA